MRNKVLNFSFHLRGDEFRLPVHARIGFVPDSMDAVEAAELAEAKGFDILVVTHDGQPRGVFFRRYLEQLLPEHHLVRSSVPTSVMSLSDRIRAIDIAGIQFHSEAVNDDTRVCPMGHLTPSNPCVDHPAFATEPYQP
jgi:hypothetical protein